MCHHAIQTSENFTGCDLKCGQIYLILVLAKYSADTSSSSGFRSSAKPEQGRPDAYMYMCVHAGLDGGQSKGSKKANENENRGNLCNLLKYRGNMQHASLAYGRYSLL